MEEKKRRVRLLPVAGRMKTSKGEVNLYHGLMRKAVDEAGISTFAGKVIFRRKRRTG